MKLHLLLRSALIAALTVLSTTQMQAQSDRGRGPISHHTHADDKRYDDEYRMSHLDADAGDLIGLVLPRHVIDLPIKSARWEPAESSKVKLVEYSSTSASIRLLSAGTTVVNYKYKYMKDGKEESGTYPFTIRIHRIEPETISLPSTIYLGWGLALNLNSKINLQPEYSEIPMTFTTENPDIVDVENSRIIGRQLGETRIFVETTNGLSTEARVIVVVPELSNVNIVASDKKLDVGDQEQLQLETLPLHAEPTFTWSSDKPEIVSVDENGVITAHSPGKTTIRVISNNGLKDSITIRVNK